MKHGILILILLSFSGFSYSQQSKFINSIKELTDSIDKIIQQEHITGLMLGITTKDSVLFCGGFGYADINTKRKVDETTLFRLGSITKMFVSLGIMKLVREGKLNLSDELAKIAPEVPFKNEWESTHPVRILNLLEHTSGCDDIKLNRMYSMDEKEPLGMEMMMIHEHSMICRWKPGERQSYSNPNYAILGYIIQKITGKPYDVYLTEHILIPFGMNSSNFNLRSKIPQKDVKEYIVKNGQAVLVPSVTLLSGPQGALWSSAQDMVKFIQLFLRDGTPLFNKNIIEEIETSHSPLSSSIRPGSRYALGNAAVNIYGKYLWRGHDGLTGTCYSDCDYNRALNIGFVISSNCNHNNNKIWKLIIAYLEQDKPSIPIVNQPIDLKAIESYLGVYQFESPRNEISAFADKLQNLPKIYLSMNKLYFKPLIGEHTELLQLAPMTFALMGANTAQVVFIKNPAGKNCMLIGGDYFEKTSSLWAFTKRGIILFSTIIALSTYILGIVSFIFAISGKLKWNTLLVRVLPMVGISFLIWAVYYLMDVRLYTYKLSELGTMNPVTLIVFGGTLTFGVISLATLVSSLKTFIGSKGWFAWYFLFIAFSMSLITCILLVNGWIGLRTWTL